MLDAVLALNETDTNVFDFAAKAAPPADAPSGHITVPDAHLLFNGEFQRFGTNDLKIVGDGTSFFIRDYFASDKLANLMSPEGATLNASVVAALAGPLAPGQSAQAGAQQSAQPVIGRVDALSGSCTVIRNGVSVALNAGDTVRKGDVVQTAGASAVAIVFADGSTFSLSANARMVLDEFVYNAGGGNNSALISLVQGTFSFVAGQVAKNGDMRVDTPVATMGIRGTAVLVEISANDGQTNFSVMVEPDGTTGSFNLYNKTTGALIGTVSNSQVGWQVTPAGPLQVVAQQLQKTPAQLQQELGIVQQIFTIFNNNQQNPFNPDQQQNPERRGDNPNDSNPQTAQGGGGSGGVFDSNQPDTPPPTTVGNLPQPGTHVIKLPPLPNAPPPVIPTDTPDVVTVVVTPNAPPIAVDDPNGSDGGGNVITPVDGTPNDSDPEGSDIVVKTAVHLVQDPETSQYIPQGEPIPVGTEGATIEGAYGTLTIHPDGTYTFAPHGAEFDGLAQGEGAADKFQYTISDPFGATATAVLSINLTGVNDAPVAGDDSTQADPQGIATGHVLTNDTDPDNGDAISVVSARHLNGEATGEPTEVSDEGECGTAIEGTCGTLYLHTDGSYTFTPNEGFANLGAGQTTVERFEYTITDEHNETATAVLSITLTGVNHAPTADDVTLEANVLGNGGFEAAQDFEGWTISETTSGLSTVYYSDVSIDRSGSIFEGDAAVAVLSFSGQVPNQPYPYTDPASADGPSITSDVFSSNTGDIIRFVYQLSAGTSSGSGDRGTVTGKIIDVNTGQAVQTICNEADLGLSTGPQTVNVQLDHSGEFRIEFTLGSVDETLGRVVGARLDLGFAGIMRTGVSEDTPFTFSETAFLANTIDADGDLLSIASASSTNNAVVTVNEDGSVTYDARTSAAIQALGAGEIITDTITFTVRDEHGAVSNQATATIVVQGVNDAPTISFANATMEQGGEGGTTLRGLSILDIDAAPNELFDVTVVAQHGAVAQIGGQPSNIFSVEDAPLSAINQVLSEGIVYTNPVEAAPGAIDKVELTVTDAHGGADSMNFIFSVDGDADATLVGTQSKDVIFSTAHNDTMTGNAGADNFVFSAATTASQNGALVTLGTGHDTITDFNVNEDRILIDKLPIASIGDLTISQGEGNSTIINLGYSNGTITLNGVAPGQLSTANFIFHPEMYNTYA